MDLIEVLQQSREDGQPANAMTTKDIRKATGWSYNRIYAVLQEKIEQGEIEPIPVKRTNIAGHVQTVTAWQVVAKIDGD